MTPEHINSLSLGISIKIRLAESQRLADDECMQLCEDEQGLSSIMGQHTLYCMLGNMNMTTANLQNFHGITEFKHIHMISY